MSKNNFNLGVELLPFGNSVILNFLKIDVAQKNLIWRKVLDGACKILSKDRQLPHFVLKFFL